MDDEDAQLRDQLIEARERIRTQLNELQLRSLGTSGSAGRPPDYSSLIDHFEEQLREIDELLGGSEA